MSQETLRLRAGALSMEFEPWSGQLRNLRHGDAEVVSGIYAAVRDADWGTVEPVISDLRTEAGEAAFVVEFDASCRRGAIDFQWRGRIEGTADSRVRYTFSGEARSTFQRNRIGFCVLHPLVSAGAPCRVEHTDGKREEGRFPEQIAPHQPFMDIRAISHEFLPQRWARVHMEGDAFEMEDQRNWTDASFKTYCTPLSAPFPVTVEAGTRVRQQVTVELLDAAVAAGGSGRRDASSSDVPTVDVTTAGEPVALPRIGLEATPGHGHSPAELDVLRRLRPDHLRVAATPSADGWRERAQAGLQAAGALGCGVELALFIRDADAELAAVAEWLRDTAPPLHRILLFHVTEKCTPDPLIGAARRRLNEYLAGVDLAAGTDAFFTELNRLRPDPAGPFEAVSYSINPQVHAFDDRSIVETLAAQAHTVRSAQAIYPGRRVVISPVTLKMRWNPNATAGGAEPDPSDLPPAADPRQLTGFAAVWTLGSLKSLAQAGAASVTFHQTVGFLGVMEREGGSPLPAKWPSTPGGLYPVGAALSAAPRGDAGGPPMIVPAASSHPLVADALVFEAAGRRRSVAINYTDRPQRVRLDGGPVTELPPHGWQVV